MHAELYLPDAIELELSELARAALPQEACGLLLGRWTGATVTVCEQRLSRNLALPDARKAFQLDPAAIVQAERRARSQGLELLGCWHSHPAGGARPSARDLALAQTGWVQLILGGGSEGCACTAWRSEGDRLVELRLRRPPAGGG